MGGLWDRAARPVPNRRQGGDWAARPVPNRRQGGLRDSQARLSDSGYSRWMAMDDNERRLLEGGSSPGSMDPLNAPSADATPPPPGLPGQAFPGSPMRPPDTIWRAGNAAWWSEEPASTPYDAGWAARHDDPTHRWSPGLEPPTTRGLRMTGLVLGSSLLAAIVASVTTAALVIPPPAPSPTPVVANVSPASHTVIQVHDGSQAVVDVAARVSPAVVTITSSSAGSGFGPFSVPATGVGSGFVFRSDGLILTNWHVVENADQLTVEFNDGRQVAGAVVAQDQANDLAVVRVAATGLPTATLGTSANLKIGQLVVAIGSPLGTFTDSVTSGILSAVGRSLSVSGTGRGQEQLSNLLQTDAAINEGNSGGPLLDASGQVIGINVAVATSAQGIGFAVPVDAAQSVISQAG